MAELSEASRPKPPRLLSGALYAPFTETPKEALEHRRVLELTQAKNIFDKLNAEIFNTWKKPNPIQMRLVQQKMKLYLMTWEERCVAGDFLIASQNFTAPMCILISEVLMAGSFLKRSIFENYYRITTTEDSNVRRAGEVHILWYKRKVPLVHDSLNHPYEPGEVDVVFDAWNLRLDDFQRLDLDEQKERLYELVLASLGTHNASWVMTF